ncbi:MAG: c-type cytochrome [Niabella sp.]|nr:c-type cytochrome [Niabella sp.]
MRIFLVPALIFLSLAIIVLFENGCRRDDAKDEQRESVMPVVPDTVWWGWNHYQIPDYTEEGKQIRYGYQLIANTSYYLGPKGTVAAITNGMNCQNCHLNGGIVPFGNNFGKVFSTYPLYRARNNGVQDIYMRINDCFERSLNGKPLGKSSPEMQAIYAYIKWVGDGVPKGKAYKGTSLAKLKPLDRAADPQKGHIIYEATCERCHGADGAGLPNTDATGYVYPPLWGQNSFNDGAGLFRIGSMAGFVKNNMPLGTIYKDPQLSDEAAWDVAAFIVSQARPKFDQSADWLVLSKKPVDVPYGPYVDSFSAQQHKYGPFGPIQLAQAAVQNK